MLSLTATTAVPAVMPLTVITLSWMETVATAVLAEDADTVPDALLGVILPLVPADSDIDVGETVIDGVTVTSTLRVRLLSRTEIVVFPAASPYTFKVAPLEVTPESVTLATAVFADSARIAPLAPLTFSVA